MTSTQHKMLVRLSQFSRNLRYFTSPPSGKAADVALSEPVAKKNLDELAELGYLRLLATGNYYITDAGRRYLDEKGHEQADYSRIPTGVYAPPAWHVREGGEQFLGVPSRGMI